MSWNRAARTDKGVHAAGQVVSLRMNMHESKAPAFVAALNAVVPEGFEVFDCVKVTRSFNAKNQCDGRIYEYELPPKPEERGPRVRSPGGSIRRRGSGHRRRPVPHDFTSTVHAHRGTPSLACELPCGAMQLHQRPGACERPGCHTRHVRHVDPIAPINPWSRSVLIRGVIIDGDDGDP